MSVNMDFGQWVRCDTRAAAWQTSPADGVERCPLERQGGESGHATSLVRFCLGATFPSHAHPGGEELLILDGVFSDEHGDYPTGTYLRNPSGTSHAPFTREGCTLFVKLCQFVAGDHSEIRIDITTGAFTPVSPGVSKQALYRFGDQDTHLTRFAPVATAEHHIHVGGEEVFVIEWTWQDDRGTYPAGTWVRFPDGSDHTPHSAEGALLFVKRGHLPPA